jgi:hypothetical protein
MSLKINANQSGSLQNISSQFLRLQKQRQAAREATVQSQGQTAQQTQSFAPAASTTRLAATTTKAQTVPAAQVEPPKSAPVAPAAQDTVQISAAAANAQKIALATPSQANTTKIAQVKQTEETAAPTPSAATQTTTPPTFTNKDVEQFQASFGSSTGDQQFNATYDLDGNGSINTLDLVKLLGRIG